MTLRCVDMYLLPGIKGSDTGKLTRCLSLLKCMHISESSMTWVMQNASYCVYGFKAVGNQSSTFLFPGAVGSIPDSSLLFPSLCYRLVQVHFIAV